MYFEKKITVYTPYYYLCVYLTIEPFEGKLMMLSFLFFILSPFPHNEMEVVRDFDEQMLLSEQSFVYDRDPALSFHLPAELAT